MDLRYPIKIYNIKDDIRVFLSVFLWVLFATLMIQLVILPHVIPSLDDGNGLLIGGDWGYFHDRAVIIASQMQTMGWDVWSIKPDKIEAEGLPVGVASAVYFITGINKPWTLAPVNAFIFAIAALFLYKISYLISFSKKISLISILPFVIFPSAAMIYSQLHKDVYTICAVIIIFFLWCRLASNIKITLGEFIFNILIILFAFELILLGRPYMLQIVFLSTISGAVVLFLDLKKGVLWWASILAYLLISVSFVFFSDLNKLIRTSNLISYQSIEFNQDKIVEKLNAGVSSNTNEISLDTDTLSNDTDAVSADRGTVRVGADAVKVDTDAVSADRGTVRVGADAVKVDTDAISTKNVEDSPRNAEITNNNNQELKTNYAWTKMERQIELSKFQQKILDEKSVSLSNNSLIPKNKVEVIFINIDIILKKYVERVAMTREGFNLTKNARSTIDGHVSFANIKDIVSYLPRALQIGLFAPFPDLWFTNSSSPGSQIKRFFTSFEMMISYFLSVGIVILFVSRKGSSKVALQALIMVTVFIIIYSLVTSNVGALYRFRYGPWAIFNAIGAIGWLLVWRNNRKISSAS